MQIATTSVPTFHRSRRASTILEPERLETYHVKSTQMLLLRISFVRDSGAIRGGRSPTRQGHRKTLVLKLSCRRVRPDECHRPCATIQPNRANARVRSESTRVPAAQAAPQYAKPVPPAIRNIGFGRIHPLAQVRKAETHRRARDSCALSRSGTSRPSSRTSYLQGVHSFGLAAQFVFLSAGYARTIFVCTALPSSSCLRLGDDAAESHAFKRAKRIVRSDGESWPSDALREEFGRQLGAAEDGRCPECAWN